MSNVTEHPTPPALPPSPDTDAAPRPLPFPLHPNFWWAILWCVFLVLVTQIPAALVAFAVLLAIAVRDPDALRDLSGPAVGFAITVAVVVAHSLIILLSLVVLRVTAGRHWAREVALRIPSPTHALLTLALVPAFMILGSGLDQLLKTANYPSMSRPPEVGAFWAAIVAILALAGLGETLCRLFGGRDWHRSWIEPLSREAKIGLSALLLVCAVSAGVGAYFLLLPVAADLLPAEAGLSGVEDMIKAMTSLPLPVAILAIGAFPGVSEELWCRGFLGRGLVGKYGVFWGVLLTAFFFGAIHFDPRQGTYAVAMGVVLHLIYLCSRSLLVPMLLHFANNALAITLVRVERVKELDAGDVATPWHLFAAAGLLMVACLAAFWQSRTRLVGLWRPDHPGVSCPPPESDTQLVAPAPGWPLVVLIVTALAGVAGSLAVAVR